NAPSHILCSPYVGEKDWNADFNDQLYERGKVASTFTHLQVRKDQVLSHWARPEPRAAVAEDCCEWLLQQIRESPKAKPKSRDAFWEEAEAKFPSLTRNQYLEVWRRAIAESGARAWSQSGRPRLKN